VEGTEGNFERLARQQKRQEAEDMFETLVGPVAEDFVEESETAVGDVSAVE